MICSPLLCQPTSKRGRAGMTLLELMIATAIASIVLAALASLSLFSARSFVAMGNYADLDQASRLALDKVSREIRQTRALTYYAPNRLTFLDADGTSSLTYRWDSDAGKLYRERNGNRTVLLTQCDYLNFRISQRNPSNNFVFWPAANLSQAKLIDVSWRCSRQVLGAKINTESVQTAKIVIRN